MFKKKKKDESKMILNTSLHFPQNTFFNIEFLFNIVDIIHETIITTKPIESTLSMP